MRLVVSLILLVGLMSCGEKEDGGDVFLELDDASEKILSDLDPEPPIDDLPSPNVDPPVNPVENPPADPVENPILKHERLESFGTQENFNDYLQRLTQSRQNNPQDGGSCLDCVNEAAPSPSPTGAAPKSSDITNNQEGGVDEGGIVKVINDHLIVLRRGRLFSILINDDEKGQIELKDSVDAYPPEHSTFTWYDELLVYENKIIVVGYSYGYGATEIGQFLLGEDGQISHEGTYFLRSNDYYSSRNYASRLIDNKLVFYTPFYFIDRYNVDQNVTLPGQAELLSSGQQSEWRNTIEPSQIIQPVEDTLDPVLHTITTCDLSARDLTCRASSVIGPYARTFYVSPTAVYLWTTGSEDSFVYRLPFDGSETAAASVEGAPTDQFSFKESSDGILHVLLRDDGYGDAMWAPEFRQGGVALLSLPLGLFSDRPGKILQTNYALLANVEGYSLRNRFVGDYVLYGSENWGDSNERQNFIHIYNVNDRIPAALSLDHDVERIEALGDHALVVGSHDQNLKLSSIDLGEQPEVIDTYTLENSSQGERRSHGFFYKPENDSRGVLGLPIRQSSSPYGELLETSASVLFLTVDQNHFSPLGSLESSEDPQADDQCKASCVDWYGNSRPIFLGNRIFALLGYDLVEATVLEGVLTERQRLDYTPVAPEARP